MPKVRAYTALFASCFLAQTTLAQTIPNTDTPYEQPPWQACNETSFVLNFATAHVPKEATGTNLVVTGWQKLRPGTCQIISAKKSTPRYIYARSAKLHQGGIREWKGRHSYCVGDGNFTANTKASCPEQSLKSAKFLRVIPTEDRTAFIEPANYGKKAETAGLQRLLQDNNYDVKNIDGLGGRKTRKTLNAFLKDTEIKASLSVDEKFTVLEKSALEISQTIGITLCNKSSARIWSAIAYYTDNNWQSRGWWLIERGACARPLTRNLKGLQAYIYARQDTDTPSKTVLKPKEKAKDFCISEASFSAISHEYCQDRGYVAARFQAITNTAPSTIVSFTDASFGPARLGELR